MKYVAGIDGGQTGTQAAVADERGRVLGYGDAGPADEIGAGPESTRMRDALAKAVEAARHAAGVSAEARFEAIVAGVSGFEGRVYGVSPSLPTASFSLVHDPFIAHAGAFAGGSGVVVIAGTGSVGYVVDDDGCTELFGGLGYVFGDEGSAFWIARTAIASAMSENAGCFVESEAKRYFGVASLRELLAAFYHGSIDRDRLASFAQVVLELSSAGEGEAVRDACVRDTVSGAQAHLAALAARSLDRRRHWRSPPRAAFAGGLLRDRAFRDGLYDRLRTVAPRVEIVEPAYPPVLGAVLLAFREAGMPCKGLT